MQTYILAFPLIIPMNLENRRYAMSHIFNSRPHSIHDYILMSCRQVYWNKLICQSNFFNHLKNINNTTGATEVRVEIRKNAEIFLIIARGAVSFFLYSSLFFVILRERSRGLELVTCDLKVVTSVCPLNVILWMTFLFHLTSISTL